MEQKPSSWNPKNFVQGNPNGNQKNSGTPQPPAPLKKKKWYQSSLLLSLLLILAVPTYFITLIPALGLMFLRSKEQKLLEEKCAVIDDFSDFKENIQQEKIFYQTQMLNLKNNLQKEITALKDELTACKRDAMVAYSTITVDPTVLSEEYKNQLATLRAKENDLIRSGDAVKRFSGFSKKIDNNNVKQILRAFNAECELIISSVTIKNIDSMRGKIQKCYEQLNKIFETDGVSLSYELLDMKQKELVLIYSYQVKLEQERQEQKAIREQMLEEEKVRREIEREKAKIEKEETQFKAEISKLMKYLQKATDVEKQLYLDKIQELEEKVKLLEKDKENVLQREQNTRAGFVYVISNIGSFGENVYKIGMTRRLEPMDRVKELGDASVPFEFDVHAMIFSDDAPALETILHQHFRDREVNKVNHRKEFFRVSLREIEEVVKENFNATVTFTEVALAEEYRESLKLAQTV